MAWLKDLRRRFGWPRRPEEISRDVEEELSFHLEMRREELEAAGMDPETARVVAERRFGNTPGYSEELIRGGTRWERSRRILGNLEEFMDDLKFAFRTMRRRPLFSLLVVATIALGIGLNTSVFSLVNGVLLRPLPFHDPDRLVRVWVTNPQLGPGRSIYDYPTFRDIQERSGSLSSVAAFAAFRMGGVILTGVQVPEQLVTGYVSSTFFETLGTRAAVGRTFYAGEDEPGSDAVAVLSWDYWQRRFGGDPTTVGRTLVLDDVTTTVVGVMPKEFGYPWQDLDAWVPISWVTEDEVPHLRFVPWLGIVARLDDGVTLPQAAQELSAQLETIATQDPDAREGWDQAVVEPLYEGIVGDSRRGLLILQAAVAFVLLIVCANVANLLLARATARDRELAVRTALGAGRARIFRQLITESLVFSVAGGGLGTLLALYGTRFLVRFAPSQLPRQGSVGVDGTVLLLALATTLLAGLFFGLAPALRVRMRDLQATLREGGRSGSEGPGKGRVRKVLTAVQVGMALVLLSGAALMVTSIRNLLGTDLGFRPDHLITLQMSLPESRYEGNSYLEFWKELQRRLEELPDVVAVGAAKNLPTQGMGETISMHLPGNPNVDAARPPMVPLMMVTPGYFETMGIPILEGRDFGRPEMQMALAPSVILSRAMVERYWPDDPPVGQDVDLIGSGSLPIIGMVGDVRQEGPGIDPEPMAYISVYQSGRAVMTFVIRTRGEPETTMPAVLATIRAIDPDQPVTRMATMEGLLGDAIGPSSSIAVLLTVFSFLAALLAALGIYGVLAYAVEQRTHEIGIRQALGAGRGAIVRQVVREGMTMVGAGALVGLIGALLLGDTMRVLLYGVVPADPVALGLTTGLLVAVGLLASYIPARRAVRVDPLEALRYD